MIRHAVKRGTKHRTACGQWISRLPAGEGVAPRPDLASCPDCIAAPETRGST